MGLGRDVEEDKDKHGRKIEKVLKEERTSSK